MKTEHDRQRVEQALGSSEPTTALHELAKAMKVEGMGQVAMYHLFSEFQHKINPEESGYDSNVDIMDLIWGGSWAKGQALFARELTDTDISDVH